MSSCATNKLQADKPKRVTFSKEANQKIIDAGIKKARELGLNPIPMYTGENGNIWITKGTKFSIENGQVAMRNGDMVINASDGPITVVGTVLNRGEYAVIENNKAKRGADNLVSE